MNSGVYIYLFIIREPIPDTAGSARINAKERNVRRGKKKKGIKAQMPNHPTPTQTINDAVIGVKNKQKI